MRCALWPDKAVHYGLTRQRKDLVMNTQDTLYPDLAPTRSGVYYLTDGVRIKIGWSARPPRRRGGELKAEFLLFIPDGETTEAREHARWASARIGATEWFELTLGLLMWISQ